MTQIIRQMAGPMRLWIEEEGALQLKIEEVLKFQLRGSMDYLYSTVRQNR